MNILGDSSTCVAPSRGNGVRCADNPLVEEPSAPDLARNEGAAQDSNEEPECNQTLGRGNETGHGGRNRSTEKKSHEDQAWSEAVTEGSGDESYKKSGGIRRDDR